MSAQRAYACCRKPPTHAWGLVSARVFLVFLGLTVAIGIVFFGIVWALTLLSRMAQS